jgi:hypothetical protein
MQRDLPRGLSTHSSPLRTDWAISAWMHPEPRAVAPSMLRLRPPSTTSAIQIASSSPLTSYETHTRAPRKLQVKVFMPGSPSKACEQDWRHISRGTSHPFGRPVNERSPMHERAASEADFRLRCFPSTPLRHATCPTKRGDALQATPVPCPVTRRRQRDPYTCQQACSGGHPRQIDTSGAIRGQP